MLYALNNVFMEYDDFYGIFDDMDIAVHKLRAHQNLDDDIHAIPVGSTNHDNCYMCENNDKIIAFYKEHRTLSEEEKWTVQIDFEHADTFAVFVKFIEHKRQSLVPMVFKSLIEARNAAADMFHKDDSIWRVEVHPVQINFIAYIADDLDSENIWER